MIQAMPEQTDLSNTSAVHLLERAWEQNDENKAAVRLLFAHAVATRDLELANTYYDQCKQLGSCYCAEPLHLGKLYWETNQKEQAIQLWQTDVIANHCSIHELQLLLVPILENTEIDAKAIQLIKTLSDDILAQRKMSAEDYIVWGRLIFLTLQDIEWANEWFLMAEQVYPNDAGILYHLFNLAVVLDQQDRALSYLDRFQVAPGHDWWMSNADIYKNRANLMQKGQP
ncbi:MAG: hypothetical protein KDE56_00515 [Anaerolineales bacterium]|nr:hypothetical protein [Anaerolineales bacterium]